MEQLSERKLRKLLKWADKNWVSVTPETEYRPEGVEDDEDIEEGEPNTLIRFSAFSDRLGGTHVDGETLIGAIYNLWAQVRSERKKVKLRNKIEAWAKGHNVKVGVVEPRNVSTKSPTKLGHWKAELVLPRTDEFRRQRMSARGDSRAEALAELFNVYLNTRRTPNDPETSSEWDPKVSETLKGYL